MDRFCPPSLIEPVVSMVMLAGSGVGTEMRDQSHSSTRPRPDRSVLARCTPGSPAAFRFARNAVTELPAAKPSTHAEFGSCTASGYPDQIPDDGSAARGRGVAW